MNLLLGADSLRAHRSGIGRMTLEIAHAMRAHPGVHAMRLLLGDTIAGPAFLDALSEPPPTPARPQAPTALLLATPGAAWLRRTIVRARLDRAAARLVHSNGAPALYYEPNMIAKPFSGPTVAGFNDLSWLHHPASHPAERVAYIQRRLPATLDQATRFVAISAFTAADMASHLGIDPARIDVVPLAPGAAFRPMTATAAAPVLQRLGLQDRSFVLSVSTLEPRKNFDGLLAAWSALPAATRRHAPLVIVGAKGWGAVLDGAPARAALAEGGLLLPGHLPDADLAALYARCAAFAYVSRYEGFGLPLLEAMAAGAPVLAASTTACAETAGDAALLAHPEDVPALTTGLATLLDDQTAAEAWRTRGIARAAGFTWSRTAGLLLATWRRALAS